jgi:hypothetical protein
LERNYFESFEIYSCRKMKVKWPEEVTNEGVLELIGSKMTLLNIILLREPNWIRQVLARYIFKKLMMEICRN